MISIRDRKRRRRFLGCWRISADAGLFFIPTHASVIIIAGFLCTEISSLPTSAASTSSTDSVFVFYIALRDAIAKMAKIPKMAIANTSKLEAVLASMRVTHTIKYEVCNAHAYDTMHGHRH